jgi:hypothetical protein
MLTENATEAGRFVKTTNHNPTFHNRWYYIRAEARRTTRNGTAGVLLKLTVDDVPVCEYFDAQPLQSLSKGGRVAFWTIDSVLMIARAKIESENMGTRALPTGLLDAAYDLSDAAKINAGTDDLVPRPVRSDGLASSLVTRSNEGDDAVFTMRNPASGGIFAVGLQKGGKAAPLRATQASKLDMELALPANARVDLYATVDGVRHLISLGKNTRPDARVRVLGEAALSPVGGDWKRISFDLGAALRRLYPNATEWKIDDLELGALHGDDYRLVGFEGNPMGISYKMRNARLAG